MALLETRGLTVRFGGNLAVSEVDLSVEAATVTGLIGPNGAGKTTTFNMICGVLPPTSGSVLLDGADVSKLGTHKRARRGIGRTFQRLEVFSSMSVRENILVGCEIRQGWSRSTPAGRQLLAPEGADLAATDEVDLLMDRLGLTDVADVRVGQLSTGRARLVELGRALAIRPRVLLLDEPASGLDDSETTEFGLLLRQLAAAGLSILMVEHDVPLVMDVCSQIYVLDFGRIIAQGPPQEIQQNESVLNAYLGSNK
ncbi:MAG: ABC transporter ATP-binding protein [Acidimicrobiales bacterium]